MKRALSLLAGVGLGFFLTACVSTPRITPAQFPRVGLLSAYPDKASLSVAGSFFGFPKDGALSLPGLGHELTRVLADRLTAAGYRVHVLPVTADQFWRAFETTSKTKEGSDWHLGVKQNTSATLARLRADGLDLNGIDVVLVVGPCGIYYDSRFLSREGIGVEFGFIAKTPDNVSCSIGANATAFNAHTLQFTGYSNEVSLQGGVPIPGNDITKLSADGKTELVATIAQKSSDVFAVLIRKLK